MVNKSAYFKAMQRRYARNLYYGNKKMAKMDRLSIPQTDFLVNYFNMNAPFDYLEEDFVNMLSYEGSVKPTAFILAMIYLERLRSMDKRYFEATDPADLLSSSLLCAMKYLYDEDDENFAYNNEWAASCSKSVKHINEKEWEFLTNIDWKLYIDSAEFEHALKSIELCLALQEGLKRNSFTYNDLSSIFDSKEIQSALKQMLEMLLIALGLATALYLSTFFSAYALARLYNPESSLIKDKNVVNFGRVVVGPKTGIITNSGNDTGPYGSFDRESRDQVFNNSFMPGILPKKPVDKQQRPISPSFCYGQYCGRISVKEKSIFYDVKLCA